MIKEVKGNLLKAKEFIIGHQVNCKGVMGAGVAKQIKQQLLPKEEFAKYHILCKQYPANILLETCAALPYPYKWPAKDCC